MSNDTGGTFDASIPLAGIPPGEVHRTIDERRVAMEDLGVVGGILVADRRGPAWHPAAAHADRALVEELIAHHGAIFRGAIGVDPARPAEAVAEIRSAVGDGFVAVHTVPHAYGLAPDDPAWYPVYAAAGELGVPVQVELGVRPSPGVRVRSVGRPIALDGVACDFPSLEVIGLGPWPWTEEAISVAYKHPGVFLAVGGSDPGASDPSLVRFADSWGRGKVLFASGGAPIADAVATVAGFGLRPAAAEACLHATAAAIFGAEGRPSPGQRKGSARYPER